MSSCILTQPVLVQAAHTEDAQKVGRHVAPHTSLTVTHLQRSARGEHRGKAGAAGVGREGGQRGLGGIDGGARPAARRCAAGSLARGRAVQRAAVAVRRVRRQRGLGRGDLRAAALQRRAVRRRGRGRGGACAPSCAELRVCMQRRRLRQAAGSWHRPAMQLAPSG